MKDVIGVRFRLNSKTYYFDPEENDVRFGDRVIVETAHGIEMGKVVSERRSAESLGFTGELKPVIRVATQEDLDHFRENREKSHKAYRICQEKIRARNLEMKLISAEYSFDNSKLLFYFTADGRVDFRELVRDLASAFHTRIELRQVGIRDEARIAGGMGMCGRELCCHAYLSDFAPVSIKMAKEQNLSLNPSKISGVCGRLMCCLKNEEETYEYLNAKLPKNGETVTTFDGITGDVCGVNVLRQTVKLMVTDDDDNREIIERKVEEITGHGRKPKRREPDADRPQDAAMQQEDPENSGRVRLRSRGQDVKNGKDGESAGGKTENKKKSFRGNGHGGEARDNGGAGRENRRDNRQENRQDGRQENRHDRRHDNPHDNRPQKNAGPVQQKPEKNAKGGNAGGNNQRRNNHRRRRKPENNE